MEKINKVMKKQGVKKENLKKYIMVKMGWGRIVRERLREKGMVSEKEEVKSMMKKGGKKKVENEYNIKKVILVVKE